MHGSLAKEEKIEEEKVEGKRGAQGEQEATLLAIVAPPIHESTHAILFLQRCGLVLHCRRHGVRDTQQVKL